MQRVWHLTKSYIRKGKGQIATFFIIVVVAATLMNIGLLVWSNYDANFTAKAKESNHANIGIFIQEDDKEIVNTFEQELLNDKRSKEVEVRKTLFANSEFIYGTGVQNRFCAVLNAEDTQEINKITYIEKSEKHIDNPVYLPYLYHTGGNYDIGDEFTIKFTMDEGNVKKTYTVAGFYEETFLATINSSICSIILEDAEYQALSKEKSGAMLGTYFLATVNNAEDAEAFMSEHYNILEKRISPKLIDSAHYDLIKQARTVTSTIGALIVVAFSIIIMVVSLIIVRFHVNNTVEEEMQNMGALKALGYTSQQIVNSLLLQFLIIGGIGSILGIIISYQVIPWFSSLLAAQAGIIWEQGIDMLTNSITLTILLTATVLMAYSASRKILSLHPIMALRGGINTHNFKRNILPLDKAKGNITVILAIKQFIQSIKRNIWITLVIILATFTACFSGILYCGAVLDDVYFTNIFAGEVADLQAITNNATDLDNLLKKVSEIEGIDKAIYYQVDTLTNVEDNTQVLGYITPDYKEVDFQGMIYDGRFPIHDNEIAIGGTLAKRYNKEIGDTFSIVKNDESYAYLITGLIQGANYMGHDICVTEEGYQHVSSELTKRMNIYLEDGTTVKEVIEILEKDFSETIIKVTDVSKEMAASVGTYQELISIITVTIVAITVIIIMIILYMIIKTTIIRNKKPLGIQKAIGYTNKQLIMQTALNFLPVLLIGTILGTILGYFGVNPLLSTLFGDIGLVKVEFMRPVVLFIIIIIGISGLGFVIGILTSLRIRKISPHALMSE
ncbi:MAG: FtsX-like permease family protein [Coprobacillaceae bacterium]